MQTTAGAGDGAPGAPAMFLTGLGFAPVGVLPMPACTAFVWFLLRTPPATDPPAAAHPVRAFLTTDAAEAR
jgi:hypothetical protein